MFTHRWENNPELVEPDLESMLEQNQAGITWKRRENGKSQVGMKHRGMTSRKRASFPDGEILRTSLRLEDLNIGLPRKKTKYARPQ